MDRIETIIYVEPVAKGRPRSRIFSGHIQTYTPAKTRHAEQMIEAMIRTQVMNIGAFAGDVPLRIEATFYRLRPKHLAKKVTMPIARPDLDNYTKLLTDALEKFVYRNDSLICTALIKKRFGNPPRIELILELDPDGLI